jgi:hypothetical protein
LKFTIDPAALVQPAAPAPAKSERESRSTRLIFLGILALLVVAGIAYALRRSR